MLWLRGPAKAIGWVTKAVMDKESDSEAAIFAKVGVFLIKGDPFGVIQVNLIRGMFSYY